MKRPFVVTAIAVLMCGGAGLLTLGSLGFFILGGAAVPPGHGGPTSQLFSEMGSIGAAIFLLLAVAYIILAISMLRLAWWARVPTIVFIAVGALFAAIGIVASLPHPDLLVLSWQLFVIAVDAWILRCLSAPEVKDVFAIQRRHLAARIEAHT
jgi:hypothetical protein